ncbi:MAG: arginyltransferase [Pseudomonadales bacterium]
MTSLSNLKVFATHPHRCSYLEDQQATTLFIDPDAKVDKLLYSELADIGFRRSGQHIYRPHCGACSACIPTRVVVDMFKQKRKHRRIWKRNQDLVIEEVTDISSDEYYQLYERYISKRHADGDMFPPSHDQYLSFLTDELGITTFFAFKYSDQLLAIVVADVMENGLSAIYTFFDPDIERRSLGSFAILWQIEQAKQLDLPYLYLGYWIKECRKMSYKIDYRPLELQINGRWLTLS